MDRRTFLKTAGLFVVATACTNSPTEAGDPRAPVDHGPDGDHPSTSGPPPVNPPVAAQSDVLRVEGPVTLEQSIRVPGVVIEPGGTLTLAGDRDITLESSGNVLVLGTLSSHPAVDVTHTLRFVGVDETRLVGGGMDLLESDVGLWVMDGGRLDLVGAAKTPWSYDPAQPDWAPDDEVVITPTAAGDFAGFTVTSAAGLAGHPLNEVGPGWRPELLNLTRNLRIEGGPKGRAHVFIRSSQPQTVRFVALTHMGPSAVLGRYPLHFHHSGEGTRGSVVEGVVARECGKHAFVPHMSDGITFSGCVAFDTVEDPFWWDEGDASNDIVWERCVAALVHIGANPHRLSGFFLGGGDNNVIRECVAVGVLGGQDTGGFYWPSSVRVGDWAFKDNVSHNNEANGFWVWQNQRSSTVEDFALYHNGRYGISHGAYNNGFVYRNGVVFGSGEASIKFTAMGATFEGLVLDGSGITGVGVLTGRHPAQPKGSTVFRECSIVAHTGPKVLIEEGNRDKYPASYDFVDCGLEETDIVVSGTPADGMLLRAQDGESAFAVDNAGHAEPIPPFVAGDESDSSY